MAALSKIAKRAHYILEKTGRTWMVGGRLRTPTLQDTQKVLDDLYELVYNEGEGMDAQIGGVRITSSDGHYDVWIHIGEITNDNSD